MVRSAAALATARRRRGHTQETLAQHLGVDVSSIARWERGTSAPSPRVRGALAGELALSLDQLADLLPTSNNQPRTHTRSDPVRRTVIADEDPELIKDRWSPDDRDALACQLGTTPTREVTGQHAVRVAHQWLITPAPPLPEARERRQSPQRIGVNTLERLQARLRYLHHADDLVAGGDLHTTIQHELASTAELLRSSSYTDTTGHSLLQALAELAELTGWSTADAGHTRTAEHYYLHGIQAAHAAGDPVLAAHLVSSLGYHLAETGTAPREAVLVTRSALARLDSLPVTQHSATPSVRALLHARTAWAHALADEPEHAAEQIHRAEDAYGRRANTDPDPPWSYWLTPEEMEIILGRLDTHLSRPHQGQRRLRSALQHCDPRRIRETALYTIWLAQAHLQADETDQAHALAREAHQLSETIPSTYSDRALTHLTQQLTHS